MATDFLTPFLELDEAFCKNFRGLDVTDGPSTSSHRQQWQQQNQTQRVLGFQRRHSLCPVTLPNSKFNSGNSEGPEPASWGLGAPLHQHWSKDGEHQLPQSSLHHIPFRVDRSVSMIEGHNIGGVEERAASDRPALLPPPGLALNNTSPSCSGKPLAPSPPVSTRYKTELCRTFEESGVCKYGAKCQFAHGLDELRGLSRHPKYKTEPCRTFHTIGFCPYGARCHFIHNAEEVLGGTTGGGTQPAQKQKLRPPLLRQSVSFSGFSSAPQMLYPGFQPVQELPSTSSSSSNFLFTRASSVSPSQSSASESPELLSPLFPEPGLLKHCPFPFSGVPDLTSSGGEAPLCFYAITDSSKTSTKTPPVLSLPQHQGLSSLPGLQRCSSADSLCEEGYTSSCSLSSSSCGSESPSFEGRRLPIFSRLSVSDE